MAPTMLTYRTQRNGRLMADVPPPGRYLACTERGGFRLIPLDAELVRIGRGMSADVGLDDGQVSRRHALVLSRPDGTVEVVDEHSHNGTYVNGHRIRREKLAHGDAIRVGHTYLVFIDVKAPPATAEFDALADTEDFEAAA